MSMAWYAELGHETCPDYEDPGKVIVKSDSFCPTDTICPNSIGEALQTTLNKLAVYVGAFAAQKNRTYLESHLDPGVSETVNTTVTGFRTGTADRVPNRLLVLLGSCYRRACLHCRGGSHVLGLVENRVRLVMRCPVVSLCPL